MYQKVAVMNVIMYTDFEFHRKIRENNLENTFCYKPVSYLFHLLVLTSKEKCDLMKKRGTIMKETECDEEIMQ